MTTNDGGSAFPSEGEGHGNPKYHSPGMTLRDFFAGQALAGVIAKTEEPCVFVGYAADAYAIADAMLAERSKPAAMGEWQPIETAPKDGTEVDLWAVRDPLGRARRYTNCSWGRPTFGTEPWGEPCWRGLENQHSRVTPTHWMAPPAPPLTA